MELLPFPLLCITRLRSRPSPDAAALYRAFIAEPLSIAHWPDRPVSWDGLPIADGPSRWPDAAAKRQSLRQAPGDRVYCRMITGAASHHRRDRRFPEKSVLEP